MNDQAFATTLRTSPLAHATYYVITSLPPALMNSIVGFESIRFTSFEVRGGCEFCECFVSVCCVTPASHPPGPSGVTAGMAARPPGKAGYSRYFAHAMV